MDSLKNELKSFERFKERVQLNSTSKNIAYSLATISGFIILYNTVASIRLMLENEVPFSYFFEVFFAKWGVNIIWYYATILALLLFVISAGFLIFYRYQRNSIYEQLFQQYKHQQNLVESRVYQLNDRGVIYFVSLSELEGVSPEDLDELLHGLRFTDKKWKRLTGASISNKDFKKLEKHLNQAYNVNLQIEKVYQAKQFVFFPDDFTAYARIYTITDKDKQHLILSNK